MRVFTILIIQLLLPNHLSLFCPELPECVKLIKEDETLMMYLISSFGTKLN